MDVNSVIEYLKKSNKHIEDSLIDGFVNENTIKYLPLYVIETFAINKEAQKIIINLPDEHLRNISKIIAYAESVDQDYIPLCAEYYHFIENDRYSNLIDEVQKNDLTQQQIENLLFIANNSRNYFDINTIEDLNNLDAIREERNNNSKTHDPNVLLLNKYGISYDKAYNLFSRYGKDLENLPDSPEKKFLSDLKNILEGKGSDNKICADVSFLTNIDSSLRNFFSNIYDNSFYTPTDDKKIGNVEGVDIYDAGVDFNMDIYSYGLATEYEQPENFKDDWNRPKIETDYMCSSIINSASIKTHVKHCLYGFNQFGRNNLSLLGSNDLGTGGVYHDINVTNPYLQDKLIADVEFRTPDNLINHTRFTNNEVYRSRRRVVNGKLERINPNYVVYLRQNEDINNDPIWKESLKAAKDFGIPIVVIDCKKCLSHNIDKIEKKIQLFESRSDDSKILSSILESIYTLSNGYRSSAPQLIVEMFGRDKLMSYLNRMINHIDEISTEAPETSIQCIDKVIETMNTEFDKVLKSPHWVEEARKQGYEVEKPSDIIGVFQNKKNEIKQRKENEENVSVTLK